MFHLPRERRGLSLVELLVAVSIMGLIAAALGTLVTAVNMSSDYAQGHGIAVQHARVAMFRIHNACVSAKSTDDYPGFWVVTTRDGSWSFPDVLVVWKPSGAAANADGPPLVRELVFFSPDPNDPSRLLEVTLPNDNRAAPLLAASASWTNLVDYVLASADAQKVLLTDRLRVGTHGSGAGRERGVVRFETRYHPTVQEWTDFQTGATNWEDLTWPQNVYGSTTGLRQCWCSIEMQLVPAGESCRGREAAYQSMTFFGSASLYCQLQR